WGGGGWWSSGAASVLVRRVLVCLVVQRRRDGRGRHVLVVVVRVRGVQLTVVQVVDVVAVRHRLVPAARTVLVRVLPGLAVPPGGPPAPHRGAGGGEQEDADGQEHDRPA